MREGNERLEYKENKELKEKRDCKQMEAGEETERENWVVEGKQQKTEIRESKYEPSENGKPSMEERIVLEK